MDLKLNILVHIIIRETLLTKICCHNCTMTINDTNSPSQYSGVNVEYMRLLQRGHPGYRRNLVV